MPNGKQSPLHPRPALFPAGAPKYAARASNLLPGFTVDSEHAVVLCERDIEYRKIPFLTREQQIIVDALNEHGRNARLPR